MAKKKVSSTKTSKSKKNSSFSLKKLFSDHRFKLSLGIFLIIFALILLLSFFSYLFTWKIDNEFTWSNLFSGDGQAENWAAKLGAILSNQFISRWFGLASFSFPFIFLILGLRLLKIKLLPVGKSIRYALLATIWFSIFLAYLFGDAGGYLQFGPGGANGIFLVKWLNTIIGKIGTFFLLFISLFVFLVFTFDSFIPFLKTLPGKASSLKKANIPVSSTKSKKPKTQDNKEEKMNIIAEETPLSIEIADDELVDADSQSSVADKDKALSLNDDSFEIENETDESIVEKAKSDADDVKLSVKEKTEEEEIDESEKKDPLEEFGEYDPTLDLSSYVFPDLSLLDDHQQNNSEVSKEELISNKNKIVETLSNYKIKIEKIKATIGPTITLYEIVPAAGVRISKIKNLEDDIALSLAALGIRIIAPIPGKGTIGIEVPNRNPEIVSMRTILASHKFQDSKFDLPVAIGKTISNDTFVFDLAKAPHLLVAGATGQGKSVGLNAIIASLLYKKHPAQVKFVLIDPKKVELTLYNKIEKHFLAMLPDGEDAIITDTKVVVNTLHSLTIEMDQRYNLLKKAQARNIKEYNSKFIARKLNPENGHRFFPYIVVVIDEFADLIMTAGKEVEAPIARIAQLARAVGLHLIIATQRPSTNIITGLIKANFPARIAFRVTAMVDSRTILDSPGANQLIGRGDMLISMGADMLRIQCAFIDTPEIERITEHIEKQQSYPTPFYLPEYIEEGTSEALSVDLTKRDDMFDDAARLVVIHQQGSTSLIQRKFSIGYNRAGRIIDQLEAAGIVGPYEGSKARQVLYPDEYSLEQYLKTL